MDEFQAVVIWSDGTHDHERDCSICGTQTCIKPTHTERYKILNDKLAQKWDTDNPCI